jgi:FkbM family methyltransferase
MIRQPLDAASSEAFRSRPFLETLGERFRSAVMTPALRVPLKRLYHAALMAQTGGRGMACRLPGGEIVRVLPEHRYLSWNQSEYAAFRAAINRGGVALDVGANVGAYAMVLGQWVGPSGAVFAFEPAPAIFDGLAAHVRLNDLGQVVRPVRAAVGDRTGTAELILSGTAGESRLAAGSDSGVAATTVQTVSIDDFCACEAAVPDFIKIDVEGWELAVLRGARNTIRARGRSLALFVEMHPSIWPALSVTRADLIAEIDAQDLQLVPLTSAANPWSVEGVCMRLVHR